MNRRGRKRKGASTPGPRAAPSDSKLFSKSPPPEAQRRDSRSLQTELPARTKASWAGILLLVYATVATWGQFDFSDMMGYYGLFIEAVLQGRLDLEYTPDQVNLVDMIPYQGKYHFQWGPFPVVFHLLARLVGAQLSDRVAAILAGWLASLVFLEIILLLRRRYFADLPNWVLRWFFFAFALGLPTALVVYRGTVYNEVIGIGGLLVLLAFWMFLRYQERLSGAWAGFAGVCIGLAILTRVTLGLYSVGFFLGFAAVLWRRQSAPRLAVAHLVLFTLPVMAGVGGQLGFNYARFGSPWTYGQEFKPGPTSGRAPFLLERIPENVRHYLLAPPKLSFDFPYIDHVGWPPIELTTRAEAMSSLILCYPFLLLTGLAWVLYRRDANARTDLRLATALAAGSGGLMFLAMLCFVSASRRYSHDFLPMFMIVAFVGVGVWWPRIRQPQKWHAPAWAVLVFSALLNAQVAFYQSFRTPTPDLNAMRTFIALSPAVRTVLPGPKLDREEAVARHDLATLYLRQRRFDEALEHLERAAQLQPNEPRIQQNLRLARKLAEGS